MRHDWEQVHEMYPEPTKRRCRNCGAVQKREAQHAWMRVTGYTWEPPGCKANMADRVAAILRED